MIIKNERNLFTWKVYTNYAETEKVREVNDGMGHIYPVTTVYIRGEGESREYHPVEFPGLYIEFQRIHNKESVWGFIRKFGLPLDPKEVILEEILFCAKNIRECLRLYDALKNNLPLQGIELEELLDKDSKNVHEKLKRFNKEKVLAMGMEKWAQIVSEAFKVAGRHRTLEQGRKALMEHINKRLEGVRPVLFCSEEGFAFGQTCNTLLQFIYLQVFDHITNRRKFEQCQVCGSWFIPTKNIKNGMKFCPPLPWEKKSRCANLFYVREYRDRHRKNNGV
ncbi:MAG: hypothetical protein K6T66_00995 [Peptococcaceae bacterium]|nr:hypothetical protein [Peptococcaceae bacterium]